MCIFVQEVAVGSQPGPLCAQSWVREKIAKRRNTGGAQDSTQRGDLRGQSELYSHEFIAAAANEEEKGTEKPSMVTQDLGIAHISGEKTWGEG